MSEAQGDSELDGGADASEDALTVQRAATMLRRIVFVIYAAGLAMGTHWPRLELGDPMHPPDKLLHFVCFAGLAVFLHQARYFRSPWLLAIIGVAWTIVDELTQQFPGSGRSFSSEDIVASSLGFVVATALCWALRPRGAGAGRMRRRYFEESLDRILARPVGWMAIASAAALGAATGMPLAIVIDHWSNEEGTPFQAAVVGGLLGAATLAGAMMIRGVAREESIAVARGRHIDLPTLTWGDVARACVSPIAGGIATLVAGLVLWQTMLYLRRSSGFIFDVQTWIDGLSKGMEAVIDATIVGLIAAVVVDRCAGRLTRRLDAGDRRCISCGQDLRGTLANGGVGRCSECGAHFVRE